MKGFNTGDGYMGLEYCEKVCNTFLCQPYKNIRETNSNQNSRLPTCPLRRGEILFSKGFFVYTDIRKLQDKAKTSYTLSTRRLRFMSQTAQCLRHISHEPGQHLPNGNNDAGSVN